MSDPTRDSPSKMPPLRPWQRRMHEVIFEADTPAGRAFDVALLLAIVFSIVVVMLESVSAVKDARSCRCHHASHVRVTMKPFPRRLRLPLTMQPCPRSTK